MYSLSVSWNCLQHMYDTYIFTLLFVNSKALGVVHRVLCYQKRCKIRLVYNWKELWSGEQLCALSIDFDFRVCICYIALVNILKFFGTSEDHLLPKFNIFLVSDEVSNFSLVPLLSLSLSLSLS